MKDQARIITKSIGDLKWLARLIENQSNKLLSSEESFERFTDHSVKHSWRLLDNLSSLVENRLSLYPHEALVLFGSALFHDIGMARPKFVLPTDQKDRDWFEAELRKNHGEYSAWHIRNILNLELNEIGDSTTSEIRQNLDLLEGIARICEFHTAGSYEKDKLNPPSHRLSRLPLLGALFILADTLDTGFKRVSIPKVTRSTIPLEQREYWLSLASINGFWIQKDTIVLVARKPIALTWSDLEIALQPYMTKLNHILKWSQNIFSSFEIRPLSSSATLSIEEKGRPSHIENIELLHDRHVFEQRHQKQCTEWRKRMDAITLEPGVIAQHQVENEFLVLRRWGSSTHRFFSDHYGLQKGGGYFLSWNGGGLAIDPGYDFLSNAFSMRNLRFTIGDFDAALVSHSHDDHTQDLETLLSLQYRLRRNGASNVRFDEFPVVCSEGVRWKYAPILASNNFLRLLPIIPTRNSRRIEARATGDSLGCSFFTEMGIELKAIVSYHGENPWHLHNTGISLKLYLSNKETNFCWGYTSDTGFEPELIEFFSDTDLLLLHLGDKTDNGRPPRHHLGEDGCVNLISALKARRPRLFILGEFGADEFLRNGSDDRVPYTTYIEQITGVHYNNKRVLPADIGLRVRLPNLDIWCETTSSKLPKGPTSDNPTGSWRPFSQVVPRLGRYHQIHYTA